MSQTARVGTSEGRTAPEAPPGTLAPVRALRCDRCELQSVGKVNCLPGRGSKRAGIMIVTSAITPFDEEARKYASGDHGRKLGWLLERAGLSREGVFVTGAVRCPRRKGGAVPKKTIMDACRPHLDKEIAEADPAVIITMGPAALKQVLGLDVGGLDGLRGFPIRLPDPSGDRWVIPMWDISRAFAYPEDDGIVVRDLKLAAEIAEKGWKSKPLGCKRVAIITDFVALRALAERLKTEAEFGFDLETEGLDFTRGRILCASFGFADGTAAVVPVIKPWRDAELNEDGAVVVPASTWSPDALEKVYAFLRFAMNTRASKTAQNGKFDVKWLRRDAGVERIRNFDFDTMLAWALLEPDKPADLLFIGQWLGVVNEKYDDALEAEFRRLGGKRDYSKASPDVLFRYAGIDAWLTLTLRPILQRMLEEAKLDKLYRAVTNPLSHVVADMEYGGVRIDRSGMEAGIERTKLRLEELLAEIRGIAGKPTFNPNSPKQLVEILKGLGVKLTKTTKTGQLAVGEDVLKGIAKRGRGSNLPRLVVEYREQVKFMGTYLVGLLDLLDPNDFLHTTFKVNGTYTGRLSSLDPNLQNIPKAGGIRELFIVDEPGDVFLGVDYSQLEVRIAAAVTRDPVLIREIRDGTDMHSDNACRVWGYDLAEFKVGAKLESHPKYELYSTKRDNVKRITFGVLYGGGAEGVSEREEIPLEEVEEFIEGFFRKYRVLAKYMRESRRRAWDSGVIRTRLGRRYRFLSLPWLTSGLAPKKIRSRAKGDIERVGVNMPIQSCGSDIFSMKKVALHRELRRRGLKSRLVLTIHDGFVMNVKPYERAEVEALVPEIMNCALNEGTADEVKLFVEMKIYGEKWKK